MLGILAVPTSGYLGRLMDLACLPQLSLGKVAELQGLCFVAIPLWLVSINPACGCASVERVQTRLTFAYEKLQCNRRCPLRMDWPQPTQFVHRCRISPSALCCAGLYLN